MISVVHASELVLKKPEEISEHVPPVNQGSNQFWGGTIGDINLYPSMSIRETLQNQRKALLPQQQTQWSDDIAAQVLATEVFQQARHIACYLPINGEVQTQKIISAIWELKKSCYLPVLMSQYLQFAIYTSETKLVKSAANFLQPAENKNIISAEDLDLVLVPLVGFDAHCHRLGMGAGYYDRSFAFLNTTPRPKKPFLLGLAYAMQQISELTKNSWDVNLNMVITETTIFQLPHNKNN